MKRKQALQEFIDQRKLLMMLLLFFAITTGFAQERGVSGTILDETGMGLPGVTIMIKGTSNGTITDIDGRFSLTVSGTDAVLVISSVGFLTQEIAVGTQSDFNVTMESDVKSLDEVVVVGYGTQKKSQLTGALSSVSSKDFEEQPLGSPAQALQGRAAGVQITQTGGGPGGGFKIRIRGASSITGGNSPLYVIDGQFGEISSVNVNDIQSMEVLKDAAATAIYGTRGANGVVLITTKKGTIGKTTISANLFTGYSNVMQKLDLMNAYDFAEGVNFAEGSEIFTAEELADLKANGGEDWQERLFQKGLTRNVQISASGGTEESSYYISGNYFGQTGTIVDSDFKRFNLRGNFNMKLSEKVKLGLNFNGGHEQKTGVRADLGAGLAWDPTTPAFDENGDYNFASLKGLATSEQNPLVAVENNSLLYTTDRISVNGNLNWDITDNLLFNSSIGITRSETHENDYAPKISSSLGIANVDNINESNFYNTNRFTYTVDLNSDHSLKIDAIQELVIDRFYRVNIDARNFVVDAVSYKNLSAAETQIVSNFERPRDLLSYLGRINYAYRDKYLVSASYRADGTSVFQKDKWGYFPSASVAWVVSKESFLEGNKTVDNLKLRMSYGQVGNQGISPFDTRDNGILSQGLAYPFDGTFSTGVAPSNKIANPDLTWETTSQLDAGVDIGLFQSAVTVSIDVYKKNTTDLLLDAQLPQYVGPTVKTVNAGEVENKGLEITLGTTVLENDDWNINSTLTVSMNRNKVLSLNGDVQYMEVGSVIRQNSFPVNPTRVEVGLPINSFRGYVFQGVYQLGEEAEAAVYGKAPGDAKYKDINDDGIISTDDITIIGSGNPDFIFGWNWSAGYKNWSLNFLLTGSQGNQIYNLQRARLMSLGAQQFHAVHGDYRNRWTVDNPSNIPSGRDGTEILSSQFIENGSYLTMKNITLSYDFSSDLLDKVGIASAKVYVSSQNLFTLTKYTGFDPESNASTNNADADQGIDYNTYPLNRSFLMGLNITF